MVNTKKAVQGCCTAFTHYERLASRFKVSPSTALYPLAVAKVAKIFDNQYIVLSVLLSYL